MNGVGQTAAVSLGTSSTAGVLHWVFQCYLAHGFIMPDESTLLILSGLIAPIFHGLYRLALSKLPNGDNHG